MGKITFNKLLISPEALKGMKGEEAMKILAGENTEEGIVNFLKNKFTTSSHGLNIEKVGNHYSFRINGSMRGHFTFKSHDEQKVPVIMYFDPNHNYNKSHNKVNAALNRQGINLDTYIEIPLNKEKAILEEERVEKQNSLTPPKILYFDDDQDSLFQELQKTSDDCIFVNAPAGNGKTILALRYLAEVAKDFTGKKKYVYVSKSKELSDSQQREFKSLYPDLAHHVLFKDYDTLLTEEKGEGSKNHASYDDFSLWYEKVAGPNGQRLHSNIKKPYPNKDWLHEEIDYIAANGMDQEAYLSDSVKSRFPTSDESKMIKKDIWAVYKEYELHLEGNNKDFGANIILNEQDKYTKIVVDEAQLFGSKEREQLSHLSSRPILYFGDKKQGDIRGIKKRDFTSILHLNRNYRSSLAVIKFANLVLGNSDCDTNNMKARDTDCEGSVSFITKNKDNSTRSEDIDEKLLSEDAIQNYNSEPNKYCFIVPNQEIKKKLRERLTVPIFTTRECHGLEYDHVVIYGCILNIDTEAQKDTFYYLQWQNYFYTAVTRAKNDITIINNSHAIVRGFKKELSKNTEAPNQKKPPRDAPKAVKDSPNFAQLRNLLRAASFLYNSHPDEAQEQINSATTLFSGLNVLDLLDLIKSHQKTLNAYPDLWDFIIPEDQKGMNVKQINDNIKKYDNFLASLQDEAEKIVPPANIPLDYKFNNKTILEYLLERERSAEKLQKSIDWRTVNQDILIDTLYSELDIELFKFILNKIQSSIGDNTYIELAGIHTADSDRRLALLNHALSKSPSYNLLDRFGIFEENEQSNQGGIYDTINNRIDPIIKSLNFHFQVGQGDNDKQRLQKILFVILNYSSDDNLNKNLKSYLNLGQTNGETESELLTQLIKGLKNKNLASEDNQELKIANSKLKNTIIDKFGDKIAESHKIVIREIKKIKYKQGSYRGEVKDGKPNGLGEFKYNDGSFYGGEVKNGEHHGEGVLICKNGDTYNG